MPLGYTLDAKLSLVFAFSGQEEAPFMDWPEACFLFLGVLCARSYLSVLTDAHPVLLKAKEEEPSNRVLETREKVRPPCSASSGWGWLVLRVFVLRPGEGDCAHLRGLFALLLAPPPSVACR